MMLSENTNCQTARQRPFLKSGAVLCLLLCSGCCCGLAMIAACSRQNTVSSGLVAADLCAFQQRNYWGNLVITRLLELSQKGSQTNCNVSSGRFDRCPYSEYCYILDLGWTNWRGEPDLTNRILLSCPARHRDCSGNLVYVATRYDGTTLQSEHLPSSGTNPPPSADASLNAEKNTSGKKK